MLEFRLKALGLFEKKPMPRWGADLSGIDFDNIKYFVRSTEKQATSWDELPADIKNTYDKLGIPEAEKARLVSGVAAQYESEVVYHQIREDLEQQGVIFLDTDTGAARAPGAVPRVLRLGDPERGQQVLRAELGGVVGRVVHLRAAGRARRHPAAGLLPDQHREHGPVRAHADHRRRGCLRALRRGLHRADLQVGLAALRGGRDHREEGRPLPLHDHPELVEQRLQPGHQAGQGLRGRDHGVGRRQPRLQGHDEVPGRAAHGRARQGRGAVDRVRGRGPAPGRRGEDDAPGAAHVVDDHQQVRRARRWPDVVPRPGAGEPERAPQPLDGEVRRAAGRHDQPLGHLPVRGRADGRRVDGPRGHGVEGQRRPALLPDEPRADRGRGHGDGRARVRRAHRARAAHGVRAGAEPADRAADGGRRSDDRVVRPSERGVGDRVWLPS